MAEDWVQNARSEARAAFNARSDVEVKVGALKENQAKLAEQLKEAVNAKDSSEAGLKNAEMQAEEQRKLKNNANNCIILRLIWQRRSNQ